ncbi:hypothetical protein BH24ACI3_BH24ACI3_12490 [soil metagenome]
MDGRLISDEEPTFADRDQDTVDDLGTDQQGGRDLLAQFVSDISGSDLQKAALALGRDAESLENMLEGKATIDDDLVMKLKGLIEQRGGNSGEADSNGDNINSDGE